MQKNIIKARNKLKKDREREDNIIKDICPLDKSCLKQPLNHTLVLKFKTSTK